MCVCVYVCGMCVCVCVECVCVCVCTTPFFIKYIDSLFITNSDLIAFDKNVSTKRKRTRMK